jgi:hypothetical protein
MMYCSGTQETGKHPARKMKYFHTSDGCTHWACPEPNCGRVSIVCRRLPPIWKREIPYKPQQNLQKKKSFWSFLKR